MKKLAIIALTVLSLTACSEENKTVYDYLTDEPLLRQVMNDCISGKLNDIHKCNTVKKAYRYLDLYKNGALDEKILKKLGKN